MNSGRHNLELDGLEVMQVVFFVESPRVYGIVGLLCYIEEENGWEM